MNEGIFQFNSTVPADVRSLVTPYLERYADLIPTWCQRVFIRFEEAESSGVNSSDVATMISNKTYRWASVRFHCGFLTDSEIERRIDTVHELLHISLSPAYDYARQGIADLSPSNQALVEHVGRQLCALHEQGVQDLAYAIVMAEEKNGRLHTSPNNRRARNGDKRSL